MFGLSMERTPTTAAAHRRSVSIPLPPCKRRNAPVTGLAENTIYHYRVRAENDLEPLGGYIGPDMTVATVPRPWLESFWCI